MNTFCLLETRGRQTQCLQNVAGMLKNDRVFVLELFHRPMETLNQKREHIEFSI